ncbi:hypothetical protein [Alteromonas sp. a30]|uniref:hypothetical protein n=1 Tax=Alteromonas sp. a30 TaxID=2730917 RepID=UPI00227FAFF2|nr:hypothetical protein [Alteromonas sp. a30]MCY7295040.1 hypothetical protein [Alteromonas sp. a30]
MKKVVKVAALASLIAAQFSGEALAGTINPIVSESVSTEAASTGQFTANISGDSIVFDPQVDLNAADRVLITLPDGATFQNADYTLEVSAGGAGTGDLNEFLLITAETEGATELLFRVSSGILSTDDFILSGSSIAGQAIDFNLPALAAGGEITLGATISDVGGVYDIFPAIELFQYANEFSASVTRGADGVIDVNDDRLTFVGGLDTNDIELAFTEAFITNSVVLNDNDKVNLTLSGDLSGVASVALTTSPDGVARGLFTLDADAGVATFEASASDVFAATSAIVSVITTGNDPLTSRTFTVSSDLDFESESDKNLVADNTAAGEWTVNGLQAKVSQLSLNANGFVSWLKVINEGGVSADVFADIIYTLADGTNGKVTNASLGSVDAGGVATISEASILTAIGSPTQLVDVSMTVTVAAATNSVHLIAEKKAADGRVSIPVYYNTAGSTPRVWVN